MAIAFDATGSNAGGLLPQTWTHVTAGSNRALIVWTQGAVGSANVATVSFNSVAMTQIGTGIINSSGRGFQMWYLANPASGSHSVSATGTGDCNGFSVSYTGVNQSTPVGNTTTKNQNSSSSVSVTLNTLYTNSWMVGGFGDNNGGGASAGTGTTKRIYPDSAGVFDSNATVGGSSYTLNVSRSGSTNWASIDLELVDVTPISAATNGGFFINFL